MNVKKDISPKGDDGKFYITPTNKSYFCPTPGSITIMALTPNRIGSVPYQQLFKDLSDCGFNAAAIWYNRVLPAQSRACTQIDTALTNCEWWQTMQRKLPSILEDGIFRPRAMPIYLRQPRYIRQYGIK